MYQIRVYAHENFEKSTFAADEREALEKAYKLIGSNGVRVAHVLKEGTNHGIYIARHTDLERVSFTELMVTLANVTWR